LTPNLLGTHWWIRTTDILFVGEALYRTELSELEEAPGTSFTERILRVWLPVNGLFEDRFDSVLAPVAGNSDSLTVHKGISL
jgi:hypothetical protein